MSAIGNGSTSYRRGCVRDVVSRSQAGVRSVVSPPGTPAWRWRGRSSAVSSLQGSAPAGPVAFGPALRIVERAHIMPAMSRGAGPCRAARQSGAWGSPSISMNITHRRCPTGPDAGRHDAGAGGGPCPAHDGGRCARSAHLVGRTRKAASRDRASSSVAPRTGPWPCRRPFYGPSGLFRPVPA